ncbi:AMP-binding enzyme [Cellulomonas sp. S1-8]|uniref:AMP-binding enzyme n=1 Tax=Cellulomonas sp. S1-8 TaxID=2904790 RepID=UPI0022436FA3|nr:AMP-binding protein [Cellulomonas sp. S1-8]UZN03408.1 AMP-binding protein [Cellulomonas sp. S1-8]
MLEQPTARTVAAAVHGLDGWAGVVELLGAGDRRSQKPVTPPPAGGVAAVAATAWRVHTSGTSGRRSWTDHTWTTLSAGVRQGAGGGPRRRWGLLFPACRMAGLQVIAQARTTGDVLVDPTHLTNLADQIAFLAEHGVDALSATPTRWRQLLRMSGTDLLHLAQVTLGGETVDQPLLDALRARFSARVTHVYASTEAGSCFAVHDGRAGFPVGRLGDELQVRDGVLHVRAPWSITAGPDGFVCTGDLVTVDGDRAYFRGRRSGVLNVGGEKVSPEVVEVVLREHPAVVDAVATGRPNTFCGTVVVARVVPVDEQHPPRQGELRRWVAERLTGAHVPAVIDVVPHLTQTTAGKAARA